MRRRLLTVFVLMATLSLLASSALAQTPSADGDDRVTGHPYLRHDGGTDQAIQECSSPATDPAADNVAGDGDIDSNDGGSRHQNNEPFSVIDPTNPNMVVAGWNDYCSTDLGAGWMGLGFSADRGETWVNSLVPGYPQDTSAEGMASPLFGSHTDAGDPVAAEACLRRSHDALETMGDRALLSTTAALLAQSLLAQGRDREAERSAELSGELAAADDLVTQVLWRCVRARTLAGRGQVEEGLALAREAVALAETSDFVSDRGDALFDLALVLAQADRHRDAVGDLRTRQHL